MKRNPYSDAINLTPRRSGTITKILREDISMTSPTRWVFGRRTARCLLLSVAITAWFTAILPAQQFSVRSFKRQSKSDACTAFSPDGKILAAADNDDRNLGCRVILWDLETGEEICVLSGHEKDIQQVVFSPDGHICASCAADGTIRLWDPKTGAERNVLRGHSHPTVRDIVFSHDGNVLVSTGYDNSLIYWDVSTGRRIGQVNEGKGTGASRLCLSPNGKVLACLCSRKILLRDFSTGRALAALEEQGEDFRSLAYSPDGSKLATAMYDGEVLVWDAESGRKVRRIIAAEHGVKSVAFSPDGSMLATSVTDSPNRVRFWDTKSGSCLGSLLTHPSQPADLDFSPDGTLLAAPTADTVSVWSTKAPFTRILKETREWNCLFNTLAFSPDGKYLAFPCTGGKIRLWDHAAGQIVTSLPAKVYVPSLTFSTDGSTLASAESRQVSLWDLEMGVPRVTLSEFSDNLDAITLSPDGGLLATVTDEELLDLWNARTGKKHASFAADDEAGIRSYHCVAFSPDGKMLAAGCDSGRVQLRDVQSGQVRRILESNGNDVAYVVFSQDGRSLGCGTNNWIEIWDLATQDTKPRLHLDERCGSGGFGWSPDGKLIATMNGDSLRLWSTKTQDIVHEVEVHYDRNSATTRFSPDGKLLALPGRNDTIYLVGVPVDPATTGKSRPVASFAGSWDVPGGPLNLSVRQGVVTGGFSSYNGTVEGTLSEDRTTVVGKWVQENGLSGGFALTMGTNGKQIEGSRWKGDDRASATEYPWSGERIED